MNIFKQFVKSIYSPKDIALFRFQGIGKTILYVFFLTLISVLPSIIFFGTALSSGLESAKTFIEEETPDFAIKNGQLTADTKVPVTLDKEDFTFILDPTGAISRDEVADEGDAFALLKDEFVIAAGGQSESYAYSMMQGLDLSKNNLLDFLHNISSSKGIIISIISIFIYLFSSAASFIEVSIVALLGLALKNILGRRLNYGQLWRMAAYSETLPTLFFTIMTALKTTVPNSSLINWSVVLIVLLLAINEIPKPKKSS
jgi:hypothetical protein